LTLEERIVEYLSRSAQRPLTLREIARGVGVEEGDQGNLKEALARLTEEGRVYPAKNQRYALPEQINLVVGRLDMTRRGAGFVVPEIKGAAGDVFIPPNKLGGGVHGDLVVARIEGRRGRENPEGRILRVLKRAHTEVVGTLRRSRRFGFVEPDNPRLGFEVYVAAEDLGGAKEGEKVVVAIDDWGDGSKSPEGRIVEVLGPPDAPGVDILSIIKTHGLEQTFPAEVEAQAEAVKADFDVGRRLDLRDRVVFTIDPVNAKDFDDALSIRRLDEGRLEVGIHIADVSHFVKEGDASDEEAFERGTSVYLVDRVIPMLPERLSNHLCSLVPGQDRLTFSVLLTMDGEANVLDHQIRETVIHSRHRLTYVEAQAIIKGEPEKEEQRALVWEVQTMRRMAKLLQQRRAQRGSLDFDLPEAIVELDEEGFPIDIQESVRLDSMRLIEEFMLLANETVTRHADELGVPFLYRVHDQPSPEALDRVRAFIGAMGYVMPSGSGKVDPKVFGAILEQVRGKREEALVNTVILRSMKRARYSAENLGHFGLAAEHYTHFTSPIRRYPDLIVHRLLKRILAGERWKDQEKRKRLQARLETIGDHCSARERLAAEAERDSIDLKKVEFMERHLGEEFDGRISGVTAFGVFVRLDRWFVEGLVHMHNLDDDYYEFREDQYALLGRHTGRRYRLADPMKVRIAGVDKVRRQIDFEPVR
jgi:ribonuclease R